MVETETALVMVFSHEFLRSKTIEVEGVVQDIENIDKGLELEYFEKKSPGLIERKYMRPN